MNLGDGLSDADRDRCLAYYRLNSLEHLLSKGTVIISVGRSSECGPCEVFIESTNGPSVTGRGNLRNALDELRKLK